MTEPSPVLSIEGLSIGLPALADRQHAIKDLSLAIMPGETLCVVGESGSGKSMTAMASIGLLPPAVTVLSGAVKLETRRGDVILRQSYVKGSVHTDAGRVLLEDIGGDVQGTSSKGGVIERRVERVPRTS